MSRRLIAAALVASFAAVPLGCGDERLRAELTEETEETRVDARFDRGEEARPEEAPAADERERREASR